MNQEKQQVSFFQAIAISFGAIIGWGAYVMPGDLFLKQGQLLGSSLAMMIGALLIAVIARSYINLLSITSNTHSGGVSWIYQYLNKRHAFIYGWGVLLGYISIVALNISAIPLLFRYLLPDGFRILHLYSISGWDVYVSDLIICSIILIVFSFLNYKGIKNGAKFQACFAFLMVSSLFLLFLGSLLGTAEINNSHQFNIETELQAIEEYLWIKIIAIMPWAFVGFETTPQISRDIQKSKYKTSVIISVSILIGFVFYLMVNYITALNMNFNYHYIYKSTWATGEGINSVMGSYGIAVLAIAMIFSILSGINGFILASLKLLESMGEFKILPQSLLENKKFSNKKSIILIFCMCIATPWLGRNILLDIVSLASVGISVGFLYVTIADIISQRKINNHVSFVSYIACLISIGFIALLLIPGSPAALSAQALIALAIFVFIGLAMFFMSKKKSYYIGN